MIPFDPYTFLVVSAVLGLCIGLRCLLLRWLRAGTVMCIWYIAVLWLVLLLTPAVQFTFPIGAAKAPAVPALSVQSLLSSAAVIQQNRSSSLPLLLWHIGVVFVGTCIILLRLFAQYRIGPIQCLAGSGQKSLQEKYGLSARTKICVGTHITAPLTFGLLQPKLVLSQLFVDLPLDKQMLVITHEKAHLRRLDLVFKVILLATATFYWFHPLVWVMLWMAQADMEFCCDEAVLDKYGPDCTAEYTQLLLQFSGAASAAPAVNSTRIQPRLARMSRPRRHGRLFTFPAVLLISAIIFCTGTLAPRRQPVEKYTQSTLARQTTPQPQPVVMQHVSTAFGHTGRHSIPNGEGILYTNAGQPWQLSAGDKVQLFLQLAYGQSRTVRIGYFDIALQQYVQVFNGRVDDMIHLQCPPITNDCYFFIAANDTADIDAACFYIKQE